MIENFKKYSEYKDSGVEWIGEIPEHWELLKVKNAFKLIAEPAPKNNNEELLSIYTKIGVRPRKDLEAKGNKASTTDNYWIVRKGDLIVNKLLAWMGAIGISDYDGVTSPAYDILRGNANINPKFYNYLFRNKTIRHELKRRSKGIMDMRLRLYFDEYGQILIPIPPKTEQTKIANFLNDKTTQIDNYIARKEKTIALLEERKAAIINQAVTKGLNPNAEMKSSGVEWLGDIPKHWEILKLKYLTYNLNNRRIPIEASIRGNMKNPKYDYYGATGIIDKVDNYIFDETTLLIAEDGGNLQLRNIQLVYKATGKYWVNNHAHIIKPNSRMGFDFLANYLENYDYNPLISGSAQPKLTKSAFININVCVPPKEERDLIEKYIHEKSSNINSSIKTAKKQIKLIKEYRQSLISAAVTGKIDVREAA